MLSNALDQLERDLAVRLPADLRGGLAEPAVFAAFRGLMLDAPHDEEEALADTVAELRRMNREFRAAARWRGWEDERAAGPGPAGYEAEKRWPHHWLWLGGNYEGDAYFLDLSRDPAPVALWCHDSLTCRVDKASFAAWADAFRGHGEQLLLRGPSRYR